MKNYSELLKQIPSEFCRGLQKLIGYEPALPRGMICIVIDKNVSKDSHRIEFPEEFARAVSELYNPEERQKSLDYQI